MDGMICCWGAPPPPRPCLDPPGSLLPPAVNTACPPTAFNVDWKHFVPRLHGAVAPISPPHPTFLSSPPHPTLPIPHTPHLPTPIGGCHC